MRRYLLACDPFILLSFTVSLVSVSSSSWKDHVCPTKSYSSSLAPFIDLSGGLAGPDCQPHVHHADIKGPAYPKPLLRTYSLGYRLTIHLSGTSVYTAHTHYHISVTTSKSLHSSQHCSKLVKQITTFKSKCQSGSSKR
jgi:hypothetical protein